MSRKSPVAAACPCGSGLAYTLCCQPFHGMSAFPPTAEALMRSRYSAFALKHAEYLRFSWHPDTCPESLDLDDEPLKWLGLTIVSTDKGLAGDLEGRVEFVARYKAGGRAGRLAEKSRFVRFDGRWVYLDGEVNA
ncbi:YchJ family protein [Paludibacterium paludis]|uniref:UPF0225 protein GCM10011289_07830 n=1 Tax=Paludibacterium paludis TaxID=1225769 RepID=A0A918NZ87_9NEIS|nr:YchJ family protein [Paludibacterium paludis]GGY07742.1 UPF0225 protein [Paludibacterium paludis]